MGQFNIMEFKEKGLTRGGARTANFQVEIDGWEKAKYLIHAVGVENGKLVSFEMYQDEDDYSFNMLEYLRTSGGVANLILFNKDGSTNFTIKTEIRTLSFRGEMSWGDVKEDANILSWSAFLV